jgi:lipid A 4'-phosphatase
MSTVGAATTARIAPELFRWRFGWTSFTVGIIAAAIFLSHPQIDLVIAEAFLGGNRFVGNQYLLVKIARWAFIVLYFGSIAIAIAGIVWAHRDRRWAGLSARRWMFVAACLVVGPGLVANLALKDQLGRARPKHVVELGGQKAFTPPLVASRECPRNCSFVSGEASSIFALFYAGAFAMPQWSVPLAIAGTIGGFAAGLIRMAQGGHFLSDVIFAGVFMALTVYALYELIFGKPRLRNAILSSWQQVRARA